MGMILGSKEPKEKPLTWREIFDCLSRRVRKWWIEKQAREMMDK